MSDPQQRHWITYNGELYNYRDLRRALEPRWTFRTSGDTEVMLAGLVLEGAAFLERAEGMWALALWDDDSRELLLSRDRMGKKPLYFQADGDSFHCASELPALRQLTRSAWVEDLDSAADYLRYGYYLPGTTAYLDVFEILPGHVARWSPGQAPVQWKYWSLARRRWTGSIDSAYETLYETLLDATSIRLEADVDVGAFLSGGIDSSLIVALMTNPLKRSPKTFTIGFDDPSFDEREHARTIANRHRTDHHERTLTHWDREKLVRLIFDHFGQPFADNSLLATAEVSELAHKHVKVALSGDGADELFSGYQRYQAQVLMQWYTRLPRPLRRTARWLAHRWDEPTSHHSRSVMKKAFLFLELADRMPDSDNYVAPMFQSPEALGRMAPELAHRGHRPPELPDESRLDDLDRMATQDCLVYLPQSVLAKVDRASMANSLEVRAPFLDSRIVSLALSLPRSWHRRGTAGKRLLRQGMKEHLPPAARRRRKQGFAVPVHEWFRSGLERELVDLVRRMDSPIRTSYVESLVNEHRNRHRDHGYALWSLYVYSLWRSGPSLTG